MAWFDLAEGQGKDQRLYISVAAALGDFLDCEGCPVSRYSRVERPELERGILYLLRRTKYDGRLVEKQLEGKRRKFGTEGHSKACMSAVEV
jgi:hypothetical protein